VAVFQIALWNKEEVFLGRKAVDPKLPRWRYRQCKWGSYSCLCSRL